MTARLCRITTTWTVANAAEKAQTTFHCLSTSGQSIFDLATFLAPKTATWWAGLKTQYNGTTVLVRQRVDDIDITTGRIVNGVDVVIASPVAGTNGSDNLPVECSPVITLRTGLSGSSYRGRMFMPAPVSSTLNNAGNMLIGFNNNQIDNTATYFDAINAGSTDFTVGVYSRKHSSFQPISSIDQGNVMDVHRSRRRSLVESRYSVSI